MAHNNVFLVDEMLEKNPGMTYSQAVKALAAQEKMMEAAKSETVKEAKAAPAPTADAPKGGAGGMLPASVQKALGLDLVTPTSSARVSGMTIDPDTGAPKSRALDILTAASPYFSPGTGAAKTALGKAASILLPTGAAAHEAFKPSTAGQQAEQGVGGIANFLRESGLLKIPGLSPLMQSAATMGGEGVIGNLLNQAINRGPENISGQEAAGSGLLGGLMGLAGGIYPSGMRNNAVQKMEDLTAPGGSLSDLATQGLKKDFEPVVETASRYSKAIQDTEAYKKALDEYSGLKTKFDDTELKRKVSTETKNLQAQKAYEELQVLKKAKHDKEQKALLSKYEADQLKKKTKHEAAQEKIRQAYNNLPAHEQRHKAPPKYVPYTPDAPPPKLEEFVPDKPPTPAAFTPGKAPAVPKPPGPQANQIKAFYKEAGFDEADLPFVQRLAKNPDAELDKIFDDVFSSAPDNEAARTAANTTLNKVIKLFGNTKSKDVLKQKLGEHLFVTQLNPNTVRPTDNPLQAFASAAKGGDSALEKLLSKDEREAMSSAVEAVQAIAKAGKLGNFRIGAGGGGLWVSVGQGLMELTPSRLATHALVKAKDPEARKEWKAFAEYIRSLKPNPLTGGRLTRAATETIEKGLLGLGAAPVDAESVLPPTRNPGRALFTPGR